MARPLWLIQHGRAGSKPDPEQVRTNTGRNKRTFRRSGATGDKFAHVVIVYLVAFLWPSACSSFCMPFVPKMIIPIGDGFAWTIFLTFGVIMVAFIVLVRRSRSWCTLC